MLRKIILLASLLCIAFVSYAAELININTADIKSLTELKGIGNSKAHAIVTYREKNGPFSSIAALVKVKGVGKLILENNKDRMTVN